MDYVKLKMEAWMRKYPDIRQLIVEPRDGGFLALAVDRQAGVQAAGSGNTIDEAIEELLSELEVEDQI